MNVFASDGKYSDLPCSEIILKKHKFPAIYKFKKSLLYNLKK